MAVSLPTITESSEISRLAERKFSVLLPGSWTVSAPKEGDDYGVDVTLSIASGQHPSGRLAHIQLKGTRATDAEARRIRIKSTTLGYLRSHADLAAIVRVQVDEGRFWLIHLFDGRTWTTPDGGDYVTLHFDDDDEVSGARLSEVIDRLSYRVWQQTSSTAPFVAQVHPPELAMRLNAWFATRLPECMSFVPMTATPDPTHQIVVEFSAPSPDAAAVVRDLASSARSQLAQQSPGHLVLGLADFLCRTGAKHLASGLVMRSADLITQQAMDTLSRAVHQRLLNDACVAHATDNEISKFVEATVATGAHWAGEWAVNIIFKERYLASVTMIDHIVNCFAPAGLLSARLLRTKLYTRCNHGDAARDHLKSIPVEANADPVDLFELGELAETYGDHDKARYAWRQAARNGYDRVACHLELARSFVAEGRIADAIRFAPRGGVLKDERCSSLFALLDFLRSVFKKIARTDRDGFDAIFGTDEGIKRFIEQLPRHEQSRPAIAIAVSALAIILALRASAAPGAEPWGIALEWAVRAHIPPAQIDAIIALAAPMYGGEPLRIAAVRLGDHPGMKVLAKYHKLVDEKRTPTVYRRREDFVTSRTKT
jgi:hypothetical protein